MLFPEKDRLKSNTDGACRGNPGLGDLSFCIRNDTGDLVFAKASGIGETTNIEAEARAIRERQ